MLLFRPSLLVTAGFSSHYANIPSLSRFAFGAPMRKPAAPARIPKILPRKQPRQARSVKMVEDILEAAVRVLRRAGARGFTTVRVAEEAGVSVGSLYQYFSSKEALLFRLQADEWRDTGELLASILEDEALPPLDRLRHAMLVFFRSEREEAELRVALDDAGALFRDAPEARAQQAVGRRRLRQFLKSVLPAVSPAERAFAADFIGTGMSALAEKVTERKRGRAEVDAWAKASADMYCRYLEDLAARAASR
jgi:AcrR family transcriptional regulator